MTKAKKLGCLICILIVIIGSVIFAIKGFNYDLAYGNAKRITVSMKDDFSADDYKSMAKEIYGSADVEVISTFKSGVSIKVKETSDEQLDSLVAKINEKYGYEYTKDDLKVTDLPKVEVVNLLKQAVIPMVTTLIIILVYMIIRYRKEKLIKLILNLVLPVALVQLTVLGIYLICRIPVTNMMLPILLTAYVVTLLHSTKQYEK